MAGPRPPRVRDPRVRRLVQPPTTKTSKAQCLALPTTTIATTWNTTYLGAAIDHRLPTHQPPPSIRRHQHNHTTPRPTPTPNRRPNRRFLYRCWIYPVFFDAAVCLARRAAMSRRVFDHPTDGGFVVGDRPGEQRLTPGGQRTGEMFALGDVNTDEHVSGGLGTILHQEILSRFGRIRRCPRVPTPQPLYEHQPHNFGACPPQRS